MPTNDVVVTGIQDDAEIKRNNEAAVKAERKASELRREKAEKKLQEQQEKTAQIDVIGPALRSFDAAQAAQAERARAAQAAAAAARSRAELQQHAITMQETSRAAGYGGAMPREGEATELEWVTGKAALKGSYAAERKSAEAREAAAAAARSRAELQSLPITIDHNDSSLDSRRAQSLQSVLERARYRQEQHAITMQETSRAAGYGGAMPREGEATELEWITGKAAPKGSYAAERKSAEARETAASEASSAGITKLGASAVAAAYVIVSAMNKIQDAQAGAEGTAEAQRKNLGSNLRTLGYSASEQDAFIKKYEAGSGKYASGQDVASIVANAAAKNRSLGPGMRVSKENIDQALVLAGTNQASVEDINAGISQWGGTGIPVANAVKLSGGRVGAAGATPSRAAGNAAARAQSVGLQGVEVYDSTNGSVLTAQQDIQNAIAAGGINGFLLALNQALGAGSIDVAVQSQRIQSKDEYLKRTATASEKTARSATNPLNTAKGRQ